MGWPNPRSTRGGRVMLKPCPFCGGEAEIQRVGTRSQSMQYACTDCGAFLETGETDIGQENPQWNHRPEDPHRGAREETWTTEKPTEPGWYVYQCNDSGECVAWEIRRLECSELYAVVDTGVGRYALLDAIDGLWLGPLPPSLMDAK